MEGERSAEHLRWEDDPMAGIVPRSLAHLFETLESMVSLDRTECVNIECFTNKIYLLIL